MIPVWVLLMSTYNIQQVSMPLCGVKMCTDIFWSKIRTVFWEQRSRETVSFEEQVMSKDKYTSMFSCKIEAIVLIILQIFCNAREEMFMNKQIYPSFCSNHKTLSHLDLKLKRWLIVEDVRFENWGISLGWYPRISPVLAEGYSVKWCV